MFKSGVNIIFSTHLQSQGIVNEALDINSPMKDITVNTILSRDVTFISLKNGNTIAGPESESNA